MKTHRKNLTIKKLFPLFSIMGCLSAVTANAQVAAGTYFLYNRHSGLNLEASGGGTTNNTPIVQWNYNGGNSEQWNLNSLGNGQYSLTGVASSLAISVIAGSTNNDAICHLWTVNNGSSNQIVTLQSRGNGFYSVVFAHDGKAMNVQGNSTAAGASVVQYNNDGGWNSQWRFQPVSPAAYPQSSSGFMPKYLGNVSATTGKTINLIFDGDSITDFWIGTGSSVWNANWAPKGAYDFGVSADHTENLWWRLLEAESDGLNTKLVVLLIGTNNTGTDDAPTIAAKITSIVNDYLVHCPNAHILLMGIFPRGQAPGSATRLKIIDVNNRISALNGTGGGRVIFKDIGSKFLQPDGTISTTIMPDYLHPSAAGYQIWADNIKSIVDQYVP